MIRSPFAVQHARVASDVHQKIITCIDIGNTEDSEWQADSIQGGEEVRVTRHRRNRGHVADMADSRLGKRSCRIGSFSQA
jgi:hypothetical protein